MVTKCNCRLWSQILETILLDVTDVLQLRELIDYVESASRRRSGSSDSEYTEAKEPLKDKVHRLMCGWEVPPWFAKIQQLVGFIILDAFVDLFVTLCILANTLVMALDMYGNSPSTMTALEDANRVSTEVIYSGRIYL